MPAGLLVTLPVALYVFAVTVRVTTGTPPGKHPE
jgi:hypothetical protein